MSCSVRKKKKMHYEAGHGWDGSRALRDAANFPP
jgi:hypothetical protein